MPSLMALITSNKKRTLIGALFCLALAAPDLQAATVLQPTPAQEQEFQAADDNGRARILISLAKGGYHELAAKLLKSYPLRGEFSANRTLYVEGLIEQGRGNLTGAVAKYRAALADDPSLTLVRADLANALAMLDEDDSAKHHLQQLMAEAKTDQEAAGIKSFMDRLDAKRPFAFNAFASIAPSTNINDGSTVDTVYLNNDEYNGELLPNQAESGVGLSAGGSVGYYRRLGNDFAIAAGAGAGGRIYKDSDYNSYSASESAELRALIDGGYIGLGAVGSQSVRFSETIFVSGDINSDGIIAPDEGELVTDKGVKIGYYSFGPRLSLLKQVTPRDRVNASLIYEWRVHPDSPDNDGNAFLLDASWTHALSSDANVGLLFGYNRVTSGFEYKMYHAVLGGATLYKELPYGITLDLMANYRFAHFDGEIFGYNERRKDHRLLGEVTLTKRDWNIYGFAPSLDYTYIYNHSNIANYQYDSHSVELKLTKDF
jgi:hypothetical protein